MMEKKQQNVKNHRDLLNAEDVDETRALCLGDCEIFGLQPAFLPPPSDHSAALQPSVFPPNRLEPLQNTSF